MEIGLINYKLYTLYFGSPLYNILYISMHVVSNKKKIKIAEVC